MSSDPVIEQIKDKLDITEVIGRYVTLKKSGANYKAPCPFHHEKTPSFMVNRERQNYRCFGCGESGDIFSFMMKYENIDFPSALEILAGQAGITLPERSPNAAANPRQPLIEVNNLAAKFWHYILTDHASGAAARDYLAKRGVSKAMIETFQIGYAPINSAALRQLFAKHKFSSQVVQRAGSPERFRHRLMFPFRDVVGNVIGFAGRALGDEIPKYLNTGDTQLFHKNKFLYGLYEAKKAIGAAGHIVLVEGQLDVILAQQAGTTQAIATSGTALTEDHFKIMRRYADKLVLAYDGDTAGRKATERAIRMAAIDEYDVSVVPLPEGSDPGDLAAQTTDAWQKLVAKPISAIDWLFAYYFPEGGGEQAKTKRDSIYDAVFPYITLLQDGVARSYALQRLARLMGVTNDEAVQTAFVAWKPLATKPLAPKATDTAPLPAETDTVPQPTDRTEAEVREQHVLALLLIKPELLAYPELKLKAEDFTSPEFTSLYSTIETCYNQGTTQSTELIKSVESTLSPRAQALLASSLFDTQTAVSEFTPEQFLEDYTVTVQRIRSGRKETRIQSFAAQIAQAEAAGDRAAVVKLMQAMQHSLKDI